MQKFIGIDRRSLLGLGAAGTPAVSDDSVRFSVSHLRRGLPIL